MADEAFSSSIGDLLQSDLDSKRTAVPGFDALAFDDELMNYLSGEMPDDSDLATPTPTPSRPKGGSHSRNAISARENRRRKKQYMAGLEQIVKQLSEENGCLKRQDRIQRKSMKKLQMENAYLKNVIANQSTLSAIVHSVQNTPGVKLACRMPCTLGDLSQKPALAFSSQINTQSQITRIDLNEETHTERQELASTSSKCVQTTLHCMKKEHFFKSRGDQIETRGQSSGDNIVNGIFSSLSGSVATGQEVIQIDDESDTDSADDDFDENINAEAGVCLHVSGQRMSVEFCASCNYSALKTSAADHAYCKS
ncbi:hypothetical protein BaRGS_00004483 [Batillaria attramentaria]|uniref:BZIP domain-containing protein n=1 Tax=Batillaria attramentaria TaxID=370345 RepID=A0ABD0LX56_9CAEN